MDQYAATLLHQVRRLSAGIHGRTSLKWASRPAASGGGEDDGQLPEFFTPRLKPNSAEGSRSARKTLTSRKAEAKPNPWSKPKLNATSHGARRVSESLRRGAPRRAHDLCGAMVASTGAMG